MVEASRSHPSQYVKLTKDQDASHSGAGAEDIRPGELNQPVAVPQVLLAIPRAILGILCRCGPSAVVWSGNRDGPI
jgi:hypothetical protein